MHNDEAESSRLRENIRSVDRWVSVADENGIFQVQNKVQREVIFSKLLEARKFLHQYDHKDDHKDDIEDSLAQCNNELSFAASYYNQAIMSAARSWRFNNIYAVNIWIYLVCFIAFVFLFYYLDIDAFIVNRLGITQAAVDATVWGIVGALFRGLWYLWTNLNNRTYRRTWRIWFLSIPFLGAILGAIVFLIIAGGLVIVSEEDIDIINPIVIMVFAAIAGFNWQWAIEVLERVGNLLQPSKNQ